MSDTADERTDWVYLVVTVLKTKNTYRLRKFSPTLAPNEFCFAFKVTIDKNEWFKRIQELELEKVSPPEIPKPMSMELIISKPTAARILDRLAGREAGDQIITRIEATDAER